MDRQLKIQFIKALRNGDAERAKELCRIIAAENLPDYSITIISNINSHEIAGRKYTTAQLEIYLTNLQKKYRLRGVILNLNPKAKGIAAKFLRPFPGAEVQVLEIT